MMVPGFKDLVRKLMAARHKYIEEQLAKVPDGFMLCAHEESAMRVDLIVERRDGMIQESEFRMKGSMTSFVPSVGHIVQGTTYAGYYYITRVTKVIWDMDRELVEVHAEEILPDER